MRFGNVTDLGPTLESHCMGFPGGSANKESACNAGDPGLIPGSGRSPGESHSIYGHIKSSEKSCSQEICMVLFTQHFLLIL